MQELGLDNNRDEAVDDWDPIEEDSEGEDEEEEEFQNLILF